MAREKLIEILLSRTDLSREDIGKLSETEGWRIVYSLDAQEQEKKRENKLPEVCFTGFGLSDKKRLCNIAADNGFLVKDVVTRSLLLLVAGENAGPSKLKKADSQGCQITDEQGFLDFVHSRRPANDTSL